LQCLVALGARAEELLGGPQDIEWCIRGDEIFLLQSRPITSL
jgi:phosphoenolpyruvate synthase/pyruvate phosphate dikinase